MTLNICDSDLRIYLVQERSFEIVNSSVGYFRSKWMMVEGSHRFFFLLGVIPNWSKTFTILKHQNLSINKL